MADGVLAAVVWRMVHWLLVRGSALAAAVWRRVETAKAFLLRFISRRVGPSSTIASGSDSREALLRELHTHSTVKQLHNMSERSKPSVREGATSVRENQRMSMRDLEVLSSIDPITTTSTCDSE